MSETHTDNKPKVNWMRIAVMVLVPLFTVWYVDREKRLSDKDKVIADLILDKKELKAELKDEKAETKLWIGKYIDCERQIPQLLDTLKARIKTDKK